MSNLSTSAACAIYVEIPSCQPPPGPAGVVTITEVAISDTDPRASGVDTVLLWVDTANNNVLNAWIGGAWVPLTGAGGVEEVIAGPTQPTDPTVDVWYDTTTTYRTVNFPPKGVI